MGCVLHDLQTVQRAKPLELRRRDREPGEVHRHHGSRSLGQTCARVVQVDVQRPWVDVDQDRDRAEVADNLRSGRERPRRDEHLVTGSYPKGLQGEVETCSGGVDGDGMEPIAQKCRHSRCSYVHLWSDDLDPRVN